jgi:hypothetical protein
MMKYTVEMDSGAMICIPSFIKIGSGIQKLMGGIHRETYTDTQHWQGISLLSFFQNEESRIITS